MLNSLPSPVLFAHRGASAHAPENTLPAFKLAIDLGAQAIELDVQLSADKAIVCFHDTFVSRTTNGSGNISQLTLQQLKSFNAGAEFGPSFADTKIPTLDEVVSEINSNIFLNIELKNLKTPFDTLPQRVAKLILKHHAESRILISSYNPFALFRFEKCLPAVPRGLLLHKSFQVDFYLLFPRFISGVQSLHVPFECITEIRVNNLHELGKKVFVYTLNHSADIEYVLNCGVDGFFTDDPALGLRTMSRSGYNETNS